MPFQYLVCFIYLFFSISKFTAIHSTSTFSHFYQCAPLQPPKPSLPHTLCKNNSVEYLTSLRSWGYSQWVLRSITVILFTYLWLLFPTSWLCSRYLRLPGTRPLCTWVWLPFGDYVMLRLYVYCQGFWPRTFLPCAEAVIYLSSYLDEMLRPHLLFHNRLWWTLRQGL